MRRLQGSLRPAHSSRTLGNGAGALKRRQPVKINVEVDCTPEEARRAMGLPDFTPVHERYVAMLSESLEKGASPELLDTLMRHWAPMGEAGMSFWRKMFETASRSG